MKRPHAVAALVFASVLFAPALAHAAVRIGLNGDYWVNRSALFGVSLTAEGAVTRHLSVGGRFGALAATSPNTFGVPIDVSIRANLDRGRIYVEGLAGPWILFANDPIRAHVAFGFGIAGRGIQLGLEVGYLSPSPMAGLRLAFAL